MKCILHIGTEKTATTLLQKWLYENEKNLSEQGYALLKNAHVPSNRKLVTFFQGQLDDYLKDRGVTNEKERLSFFRGFLNELRAEIKAKSKKHHTLILTSEHFHSRLTREDQISALKTFLDEFVTDYKIICYFREQGSLRTSLYSTALRGGYKKPIGAFQTGIKPGQHYYNYLVSFRKWEKVFGKKQLYPRLFIQKKLQGKDIRKDFLKTVIPHCKMKKLTFKTEIANLSLQSYQAELFRMINNKRPRFIGRYVDPTPGQIKTAIAKRSIFDSKTPIYDSRQELLYDLFDKSNQEFFARYFDGKGNPFPRPVSTNQADKSPQKGYKILKNFVEDLLSNDGLISIKPQEVNEIESLTTRLFDEGNISKKEALLLLKIAQRARPNVKRLDNQIEDLLKKL